MERLWEHFTIVTPPLMPELLGNLSQLFTMRTGACRQCPLRHRGPGVSHSPPSLHSISSNSSKLPF